MVGFECGSLTSRSVVLVSNRVGWSAVQIIPPVLIPVADGNV